MKQAKMFGLAILTVGVVVCALQRRSVASTTCTPIHARMSVAQYTEGCSTWCSSGTIVGSRLNGTVNLSLDAMVGGISPGALVYEATRTYSANGGTLQVHETGIVDLGTLRFSGSGVVNGGTGAFANATGTVFFHGYSNAVGTEYQGDVSGEICGAGDDT
jgi:hypothetical protein